MIKLRDNLTGIRPSLEVEIHTDDCPRKGSVHPLAGDVIVTVGLDRFRELDVAAASVVVRVLDSWRHRGGGFVVRCKIVGIEDLPNLLNKRTWRPATHDPRDGAFGEPEGVPPHIQEQYGQEGQQANVARLKFYEQRVKERPLYDQLKDALDEAQRMGVDTARYEARIAQGVEAIRARTRRDVAA